MTTIMGGSCSCCACSCCANWTIYGSTKRLRASAFLYSTQSLFRQLKA